MGYPLSVNKYNGIRHACFAAPEKTTNRMACRWFYAFSILTEVMVSAPATGLSLNKLTLSDLSFSAKV